MKPEPKEGNFRSPRGKPKNSSRSGSCWKGFLRKRGETFWVVWMLTTAGFSSLIRPESEGSGL